MSNSWSDEIDFSDMPIQGSEPLATESWSDNSTLGEALIPGTLGGMVVSPSFEAPVVVATAAALVQTEREILRAHGIMESEQLFEDGTAFLAVGHETLESDMAEIRALPPFVTGVEDLKALIALECRRDLVGDLRKMRLDNDGNLALIVPTENVVPLHLEECAWRQLATKAGSQNINAGLARREAPAPMRIRTRTLAG